VDVAAEIQKTLIKLNMKRRDTLRSNACDSDIFYPQPSPTYFSATDSEAEEEEEEGEVDADDMLSVVSFQSRVTTVESMADLTYYIFKFKSKENTVAIQLPAYMFQYGKVEGMSRDRDGAGASVV
jgi:hypothetical protein